jgi:NADH dehydrogenase [ubiquinone] 1 alpha subcomplex assembly factor 7
VSLGKELAEAFAKAGELSFARFMDLALYGKDGYYNRRVRIGGRGADFYTAAQLPLFAWTLARYASEEWKRLGRPKRFQVVELGPGQGELAANFAVAWRETVDLAVDLRYVLRDRSQRLRGFQRRHVAQASPAVDFVWDDVDPHLPTLLIANEVLDALAVERVRRDRGGWQQAWVKMGRDGRLEQVWRQASPVVARLADEFVACPPGTIADIAPGYREFFRGVRTLAHRLVAVFFDYGIEREDWQAGLRPEGTLRAYREHRLCDVLENPGEVDLTADVNWDYARAAAVEAGFVVRSLRRQGEFLMSHGILEAAAQMQGRLDWTSLAGQIKQLTIPGGMGDRFMVLELRGGE